MDILPFFVDAASHSFLDDQGLEVLETLLKKCGESPDTDTLIRSILIQLASARGKCHLMLIAMDPWSSGTET